MYVSLSDRHIFYAAGKCGTQTLNFVDGIEQVCPNGIGSLSLRQHAMREFHKLQVKKNLPLVCVIREPEDRLQSGLFWVIAKQLFSTPFHTIINNNYGDQRFLDYAEVLYQSSFWASSMERYLRATNAVWRTDRELESMRAQYHYGNWLNDVHTLKDTVKNCTVVDIKNLTKFLQSNNYKVSTRNTASDFIEGRFLRDPEKRIHYNSLLDMPKMIDAFKKGWHLQDPIILDKVHKYLEPEIKLYQDLIT